MHDEIRRAYIKASSYQCILPKYQKYGKKYQRSFQPSSFKLFSSWLEYSPTKDAVFGLPCYLLHKQNGPSRFKAFIVNGFRN